MNASRRIAPRPLLLIALLALGGVLFAIVQPVHGQTTTTLVSNTGQLHSASGAYGPVELDRVDEGWGQPFTTGSDVTEYRLDSIGIRFATIHEDSDPANELTVTLNDADETRAGKAPNEDILCTLTNPATFTADAVNTFAAPTSGVLCPFLKPDTAYAVVIKRDITSFTSTNTPPEISLDLAATADEDSTSTGWEIFDQPASFHGPDSTSPINIGEWVRIFDTNSHSLMLEVKGAIIEPQLTSAITAFTAQSQGWTGAAFSVTVASAGDVYIRWRPESAAWLGDNQVSKETDEDNKAVVEVEAFTHGVRYVVQASQDESFSDPAQLEFTHEWNTAVRDIQAIEVTLATATVEVTVVPDEEEVDLWMLWGFDDPDASWNYVRLYIPANTSSMTTLLEGLAPDTTYRLEVYDNSDAHEGCFCRFPRATFTTPVAAVFSPASLIIDEGDSDTYTLALAAEPTALVTVSISADGDVTTHPTSLHFTPSTWDTPQSVSVNANNDNDDADDAVTITHTVTSNSAAEYAALANLGSVRVTVLDDDFVLSVSSITMTSNPIDYGNTQNTYSRGEPIRATVTFIEAVDITGSPRLTMRIGSTDKHASCAAATNTTTMVCTYTVIQGDRDTDGLSINANSISLNGGTIRKAGSSTNNALLGHSGLGRLSSHKVNGGLRTKARSLSAVTAYATETGNGTSTTMTFSVFLSRKASETVTVDYSTADGSAEAGQDYRATSGTLSFPPQTQVRTVDVTIYDDDIAEWTEYLVLVLSNPQGPAVILTLNPNGDGRIYDETPAFHTYDESAYESSSSTMRFYVSLNPEPDRETTVNYATRDVTARAGSDYTHTSGTLTFPVGVGRQTIDVDILDDNIDDSGETFQVVLSSPTGGASLRANRSIATGTILNTDPEEALSANFPTSAYGSKSHSGADDRPQVVASFSEAVASFTKDTPSVSVTNASVASVRAHTEDGLENAYIFSLIPNGDSDVTFTFEADSACASGGVCTSAGIPLTDVPTALTIPGPEETTQTSQLSVSDATASEEDDSTIDFVVTLNPASGETVSVNYATANGTATSGSDYTAKSGSLTFNAGDTAKTVRVSIIDDSDDDNNETVTLTLSNPSGAEISDGQATGTITNSEPQPLTARFISMPDSHDGSADISFFVDFSEDVAISKGDFKDFAFTTGNGDVTGANRVNNRSDLWTITVKPDSNEDVTITLPGNRDCDLLGAVCTPGASPRQLSHSLAATVAGPTEETTEETATDTGSGSANTPASGAPTIGGTPRVDETLTASTSGITDVDGLENVTYRYQWTAGGSDIDGATGSTYTLTYSEQGKTIQVRVAFTDDADNEETLTSEATVAVAAAPNRSATGAPTIRGTPQVGETLTADTSPIDDDDGLTNATFEYQWIAGESDIDGATGASYTLTASQQGKTIQVRVTFTDDANNEETLTSIATAAVAAAPVPLTASRPDSRFQSARHKGAEDRPQVIVAFSMAVASFEKTTPSLSLTGAAVRSVRQHEEDGLDNAWIFFLDPDGSDDIVFSLVTGRPCDSGGICAEDGTTLSEGVQVTLPGPKEEEDDPEPQQDDQPDQQEEQEPQSPPPAPTNLTATVNADGHIVLGWEAPGDDSITGYQILRRRPGEGEATLLVYVADTQSTATSFTDTGVAAGVKHVYRVKAINAAGLSDWSNYVNPTP